MQLDFELNNIINKQNTKYLVDKFNYDIVYKFVECNLNYIDKYGLHEQDILKWLNIRDIMQERSKTIEPQPSDEVKIIAKAGKIYNHAHLTSKYKWQDDNTMVVCTNPMTPFINIKNDQFNNESASGGYWQSIKTVNLNHAGKTIKYFQTWGVNGACAGGAFNIPCEVNYWLLLVTDFIYLRSASNWNMVTRQLAQIGLTPQQIKTRF